MTIPDMSGLTARELIETIRKAQRLLDENHAKSPKKLKCPQCGQSRRLRIETYQMADWEPDGALADMDCMPAWSPFYTPPPGTEIIFHVMEKPVGQNNLQGRRR